VSRSIGCSFKFLLKVGVEESIVNAPPDQLFTSNLTFCVVCVFTLQIDEFDSSTSNLRRNLNEHRIQSLVSSYWGLNCDESTVKAFDRLRRHLDGSNC
jgi:hypothetical protein